MINALKQFRSSKVFSDIRIVGGVLNKLEEAGLDEAAVPVLLSLFNAESGYNPKADRNKYTIFW